MKGQEIKFLMSKEKYDEIRDYIEEKEYDSVSSFIRKSINGEMRRNPVGKNTGAKKNKNVKLKDF